MTLINSLILFQFHTGSIKSEKKETRMAWLRKFQFHTGSIKRCVSRRQRHAV